MPEDWIVPDWPVPKSVHAVITTRNGGVSRGAFASMNPADHVGDDPAAVATNRARLQQVLGLPAPPVWLRQVHATTVLDAALAEGVPEADGSWTCMPGIVCAVLTADCLPVFLCSREGDRVAVAHAGWRGLAAGILPETVHALDREPSRLLAWLGPAIGPRAYEVGAEVEGVLAGIEPAAFRRHGNKWLLDLYRVARTQLQRAGVKRVFGGDLCTFSDPERFYSYRRDGETGRMASVIWLEDS